MKNPVPRRKQAAAYLLPPKANAKQKPKAKKLAPSMSKTQKLDESEQIKQAAEFALRAVLNLGE